MIAEQKVKELENSTVELTITVTRQTLAEAYAKVVQKYMKSVQLPGFRKGKVPSSVLEQKIGSGMREESVYTVIDEAVQEAIRTVEDPYKPLPYSTPSLIDEKSVPMDIDKDLQFAVTYDIMPIFELPAYTGLSVEVPRIEISDETVSKEIEKLRDQNALVIEKDKAAESGDIVTIDYVETDADGKEIAGTDRNDFVFTLGSGTNRYKIDDDVIGMVKGEVKMIATTYSDDHEAAEDTGREVNLRIKLNEVKVREVPELDDEFAQDVSEEYETVADLVSATRKKLEKNLESHLKETKLNTLVDKILEQVSIPVPQAMIDIEVDSSWRRFVSQFGMSEEQLLKFLEFQGQTKEDILAPQRKSAQRNIQVQLLMDKIKEKEGFTVDEDQLNEESEEQLKDITDENTRAYYREMIEEDLKIRKTGDFLLEHNTLNEGRTMLYEEFMADHNH